MNRWLTVVALGLVMAGCAAGVEDPQPEPTPDPPAKEKTQQTFSGEVPPNPYTTGVAHSITSGNDLPPVPILPSRPTPSHPDGNGN